MPDSAGVGATIGEIKVAGRQHVIDTTGQAAEAVFGSRMALLSHRVERGGGTLTVHLQWRAEAAIERTYKVFVHVLDASGQQVVVQRDAEPLDGRAPTSTWLPDELVEDDLRVQLPTTLAAGVYPIELGVYEERSGERLLLASGESRLLLEPLLVR
jgi:hypothetical protein